jgi:hypothetical protein
LNARAEAEAIKKVGVVIAGPEADAEGAFKPKTLFESELDPFRQLLV